MAIRAAALARHLVRRTLRQALSPLVLLAPALPALAGDGAIEINQAAALAGGVTPGDAPGFPVTITTSGNYRLVGNLTVPDENTTAIRVDNFVNDVTIDMNGHAILGVVSCSGTPVTSCTPSGGTGQGIWSVGEKVTVLNGTIRGMGAEGIRAFHLGVTPGARIEGVTAQGNAADGILCVQACLVLGNLAVANGGAGISTGDGSTVRDNIARHNAGSGIVADDSTVTNNTSLDNGGDGIVAGNAVVIGNAIAENDGYGLMVDVGAAGYAKNTINNNTMGTVSGTALELGVNVCDGDTACP